MYKDNKFHSLYPVLIYVNYELKQMILQTTENSINSNHVCLHHSLKHQEAKSITGNHTEVKFQDFFDPVFQNVILKTASTHYSGQFRCYCDWCIKTNSIQSVE